MFSIHSLASSRELIFSPSERQYCFHVELKSAEIAISTDVYQNPWMGSLDRFFQRISNFRSPWYGAQEWSSEDGELEISAHCTPRGHVILRVKLSSDISSGVEKWEAQFDLETALGELDIIAHNAQTFFKEKVSE